MIRWSPSAPQRRGCPHRRLTHLLAAELGGRATIDRSTLRPWASANFVGARHRFDCSGQGVSVERLRERLVALEWRLSGHIVADVALEAGEGPGFTIEILTVED